MTPPTAVRDSALDALRAAWEQRLDPPRDGSVGLVAPGAPLELIVAAGLAPRRLFSDPQSPTPAADAYMEPVFDGAVRSLFDACLQGRFDQLQLRMLLVTRFSEGYLQLYYFLQEAAHREPNLRLPALHLFDLLKTPNWSTRLYVRDQLLALRSALEALIGQRIDDEALSGSIRLLNGQRRAMAQVDALRREPRPRLSGTDWLRIVGAAGVLPPAEHAAMLQSLLSDAASLPARDGPRVMVKGSPVDDLRLYQVIESCGAAIVADDHAFTGLVDEDAPPLDALARHYHRDLPTLRSLPQAAEDARFMDTVEQAGAQGVVFYFEEHDDTLGWDYPRQKRLLDARGVRSIALFRQSYRTPDATAQRAAIEPWLAEVAA